MHIHRRLAERLIESYHVLVMSRLFHLFLRLSICMFYLSVFEKALLVIDMKWIQFIEQKTVRERCYLYFGAKILLFVLMCQRWWAAAFNCHMEVDLIMSGESSPIILLNGGQRLKRECLFRKFMFLRCASYLVTSSYEENPSSPRRHPWQVSALRK